MWKKKSFKLTKGTVAKHLDQGIQANIPSLLSVSEDNVGKTKRRNRYLQTVLVNNSNMIVI